jgi:hypothetical protein
LWNTSIAIDRTPHQHNRVFKKRIKMNSLKFDANVVSKHFAEQAQKQAAEKLRKAGFKIYEPGQL